MALRLYDSPGSSNALKVRFLLAELGAEYERIEIPLGHPRPPELLAVNPRGLVPVLDDGGWILCESHAILRYLAATHGREDLYPTDAPERARVDEFLDRFATGLRSAFFKVEAHALGFEPGTGFGGRPPDPGAARAAEAEIRPEVDILERVVGERYAVLDRFTIADCALAPVLFRTLGTGMSLDGHPHLAALREGLLARPAWARAEPVR